MPTALLLCPQDLFQFGGVYCGALATARFQMTNKVRQRETSMQSDPSLPPLYTQVNESNTNTHTHK